MAVLKGGHSPEGARALIKSAVVGLATRGEPFPAVARRLLKANPHAIRGVVQPPILVTYVRADASNGLPQKKKKKTKKKKRNNTKR